MNAKDYDNLKWYTIMATIINIILLLCFCSVARAEVIPEGVALRCVIGEASNQGLEGMKAVSSALRNRGTVKGVYGCKSGLADKEPEWVWKMARRAWRESAFRDFANSGTHWENVRAFGLPYWAKNMRVTLKLGDHWFFALK